MRRQVDPNSSARAASLRIRACYRSSFDRNAEPRTSRRRSFPANWATSAALEQALQDQVLLALHSLRSQRPFAQMLDLQHP
jgi:hypothetical protein